MFKKRFTLGKESLLSSKDKKNLQMRLGAVAIFEKGDKLKQVSVSGTKIKIYLQEIDNAFTPILIESTQIVPTIYTLWKNPEILPIVYTYSPVSSYVLNGADLMWPGVANPDEVLGNIKIKSVVAVAVIGNLPFAVGIISSLCENGNFKGKCVEILHCYRDELWMIKQCVPNDAFKIDVILPLRNNKEFENPNQEELCLQEEIENDDLEIEGNEKEEGKEGNKTEENYSLDESINSGNQEKSENEKKQKIIEETKINEASVIINDDKRLNQEKMEDLLERNFQINEEKIGKINTKNPDELEGENLSNDLSETSNLGKLIEIEKKLVTDANDDYQSVLQNEESKNSFTRFVESKSPDDLIFSIFLTALKIGITDSMLPLEPSHLLQIMNRCKRNLEINFSITSYKKIGKFLEHAHSLNIILYEKPKTHDHKMLTSVNRKSEFFTDFIPIVTKLKSNYTQEGAIEENKAETYPIVEFTSGYIPKMQFSSFFEDIFEKPSKVFVTKTEINMLLNEYITSKNLEVNKDTIKVDEKLQKCLKCECLVKKKEIFINFKNLFEEGYLEEFKSGLLPSNIKLGKIPSIIINLDKSKYKKIVTKIKGIDDYHLNLNEILTILQKSLAASASYKEVISGKKTKIEIKVQGNHTDKVAKIFAETFKVPKSFIVINKNI